MELEITKNRDGVTLEEQENAESESKPVFHTMINQYDAEMYHQALQLYPNEQAINKEEEKRLLRKLDARILPVLGMCYFFYVSLYAQ